MHNTQIPTTLSNTGKRQTNIVLDIFTLQVNNTTSICQFKQHKNKNANPENRQCSNSTLSKAYGSLNSRHTSDHSCINHKHEQDYSENTDIKEKRLSVQVSVMVPESNRFQSYPR